MQTENNNWEKYALHCSWLREVDIILRIHSYLALINEAHAFIPTFFNMFCFQDLESAHFSSFVHSSSPEVQRNSFTIWLLGQVTAFSPFVSEARLNQGLSSWPSDLWGCKLISPPVDVLELLLLTQTSSDWLRFASGMTSGDKFCKRLI